MPIDVSDATIRQRLADLHAHDKQFSAARPDPVVSAALAQPDLSLTQIVGTVFDGYADRPALAQRSTRSAQDPQTGRTSLELLPSFETISYRQVRDGAQALTDALADDPIGPGHRVATLGFASVEYTVVEVALINLGAVSVPLQASGSMAQLLPIVEEAEPTVIAASIEHLHDAVELTLASRSVLRLVVFDFHHDVDDHRDALAAAVKRLEDAESPAAVESLADLLERGRRRTVAAPQARDGDPLTLLIYTSGSTGTPKGAMMPESVVASTWRGASAAADEQDVAPWISLCFMPMSHGMGRAALFGTLGRGGTVYFAARSDLSTFLEDLALVRPTQMMFVPRIWDMIREEYLSEVDRRTRDGADPTAIEAQVMAEQRESLLGGRYLSVMTGSAPMSPDLTTWVEALLGMHLTELYAATEAGVVYIDGRVQTPPVTDYKLLDVPELGYFRTDRPFPRGELLVKSRSMFPGYFKRPAVTAEVFDADGFYRTGDIVAETGPDELKYVDRRNNVLKLSQGEFVAVSALEAAFEASSLVRQIYVYGNSARSYLLAVVVPTGDAVARAGGDQASLKSLIGDALQGAARTAGLQPYEIPRDFIIETASFTVDNGLLTGIRKLARPRLKEHYGPVLEQLYTDVAESQTRELRELRHGGANGPVLDTVRRAAGALLSASNSDLQPDAHFTDLGGDSLSALTFANLLYDIFEIDVPVGLIVSPATDLTAIADYIEAEPSTGAKRPSFAAVHGRDATEVHASDLTLDKFIDEHTLVAARELGAPSPEIRTVLLTGATGFLGRYFALEWLERMDLVDGKVVCVVRAKDDGAARERLDKTFDSGDPKLLAHYRDLAADRLEVIAGDKGERDLGLDQATWQRLADTVDLIVDPAALVNHLLPYSQLFGPNGLGTAELIRLAITTKLKPYVYVSTVGVGDGVQPSSAFTEDADVRVISATRALNDGYASGYGTSKWAGEVLLREAHDRCGLPVSVFRCDMIMADTTYTGQLNLPDMFTRMMLSLVATGIAPRSFYELDSTAHRQRAHYDGLPVEFIAESISTLGALLYDGFETFHVMNPHDDGIGQDEFVDWLIDAGYPIQHIDDYNVWFQRFETALRGLPERQRAASLLPLLPNYQHPARPVNGAMAPADRFRFAVQTARIGPDKDIPHVTPAVITRYVTNLKHLGIL